MSKKTSIKAQIEELANDVAEQLGNANALIEALSERRLNKAQQAQIAELVEAHANRHEAEEENKEDEEDARSGLAKQMAKYRASYKPSVAASGSKSLNNGDEVANALEYRNHTEVCAIADEIGDKEAGWHKARYQHLNNGQQRMNAGNKIRAAVKKGTAEVHEGKIRKAA